MMKTCSNCRVSKPENEFHSKGRRAERASWCRSCVHDKVRERWARCTENPHAPANSIRIARRMVQRTRRRAKLAGREVAITWEDLLPLPTHCPILGYELVYRSQNMVGEPASASVDRIDPDRGYVTGNVRVISWRANTLRNNGTLEEMRAVVRDLEAYDACPW